MDHHGLIVDGVALDRRAQSGTFTVSFIDSCIQPESIEIPNVAFFFMYTITGNALTWPSMLAQPGGTRCTVSYTVVPRTTDATAAAKLLSGFI